MYYDKDKNKDLIIEKLKADDLGLVNAWKFKSASNMDSESPIEIKDNIMIFAYLRRVLFLDLDNGQVLSHI